MPEAKATDQSKKRKKGTTKRASSSKEQTVKSGVPRNRSPKTAASVNRSGSAAKEGFPWTMNAINHFIRERAYYLWEKAGRPQGSDLEIWMRAENEVLGIIIKKTALRDLKG